MKFMHLLSVMVPVIGYATLHMLGYGDFHDPEEVKSRWPELHRRLEEHRRQCGGSIYRAFEITPDGAIVHTKCGSVVANREEMK